MKEKDYICLFNANQILAVKLFYTIIINNFKKCPITLYKIINTKLHNK